MLQRRGAYPAPPGSPADIPGLELAGEVEALGPGAERFAEGDRVMAVVGGGGQAELAVVHQRAAMPVPEPLDWPAAGGLPRCSRPRTTRSSARRSFDPGSTCSCTAPRAGSAARPCSSAGRPARA